MDKEHFALQEMAKVVAKTVSEYWPGIGYCIVLMSNQAGPEGYNATGVVGNIDANVLRSVADQVDGNAEHRSEH